MDYEDYEYYEFYGTLYNSEKYEDYLYDGKKEYFESLAQNPDLIKLTVYGGYDDLIPTDLDGIEKLTNLRELYLANTNFTDLDKVSLLPDLKVLYIDANIENMSFIANSESLEVLIVSAYMTSDEFTEKLSQCKNIKYMMLVTYDSKVAEAVKENMPWVTLISN